MKNTALRKIWMLTVIFVVIVAMLSGCVLKSPTEEYTNSFIDGDGIRKYIITDIDETTLLVGETEAVKVTVSDDPNSKDFSRLLIIGWESKDTSIATVNNDGVITAVSIGETSVFARLSDTIKKEVKVTVAKKELTGLKIEDARKTFVCGDRFKADFTLTAVFNDKYYETVEPYMIDDSKVNMGKEGEYEVSVYYRYGDVMKYVRYSVTVKESYVYDAISLDYTYEDVYKNSAYRNMQTAYCPSEGEIKYLVIPIFFTDSDSFPSRYVPNKTKGKEDLEEAFFGESKSNGWNSVKSFYETASNGKLTVNGRVSDWYEPNKSSAYYENGSDKVNSLAKSAVDWFFNNNPTENRDDYDSDDNGTLDCVAIIFGRSDSSNTNYWGKVIRPSDPEEPNASSPTLGFYMWASFRDLYADTDVLHGRNDVDSHVYIHETGHLFGLMDYYDYGDNEYSPAGNFITMELNTGGQDPFSCLALGWAKAIVPKTSCTVELKDFQSGHEVIVLSPDPEHFNSPFDEYIIIELYSPTGLNKFDTAYKWKNNTVYQGVNAAGIRIWHVDARLVRGEVDSVHHTVNWSDQAFYTDPNEGNIEVAFTNSWDVPSRISVLGEEYQDYSLLFSVRNNADTTYTPARTQFTESNMFKAGDSFTVGNYNKQFVNGSRLNSGKDLGWSVAIDSISPSDGGYIAVINLTF